MLNLLVKSLLFMYWYKIGSGHGLDQSLKFEGYPDTESSVPEPELKSIFLTPFISASHVCVCVRGMQSLIFSNPTLLLCLKI